MLLLSNPCFALGQKVVKYADVRESILQFLLREKLSLHSLHLKFAPPPPQRTVYYLLFTIISLSRSSLARLNYRLLITASQN